LRNDLPACLTNIKRVRQSIGYTLLFLNSRTALITPSALASDRVYCVSLTLLLNHSHNHPKDLAKEFSFFG